MRPHPLAPPRLSPLLIGLALLAGAALSHAAPAGAVQATAERAPIDWVDPFIGTTGEGNVFPGATLPFGFIQVSPDTGPGSGAGGYKRDRQIDGFSQQHISGMGGPLYGHISLMPATGPVATPWQMVSKAKSGERASPGYYTVHMAPWDVQVELTATQDVALHRHTFHGPGQPRVVLDASHVLYGTDASWNSALPQDGELEIDRERREVSGKMSFIGARDKNRSWTVYFVARFDQPFAASALWQHAKRRGATLDFARGGAGAPAKVQSRVALSYHSVAQARGYLERETPGWDFEAAHAAARRTWAAALGKIKIEGGSASQRTQFYTALYRVHLTPNDWTGEAPARYGQRPYYENILCMWDTFRTVNPLLTLIQPRVQAGIVNTMLDYHRTDGWTGDAHSAWHYEHVQNGSSADVIVADGYAKGLPGVDWKLAYEAVRKNAFVDADPASNRRPNQGRFRLTDYLSLHYLPTDASEKYRDVQGVSRTLEYAHNDFAVLSLARRYGTPGEIAALEARQLWYANQWDAGTGFMRGRLRNGDWFAPFDPLKAETGRQYYEGHAWTWSWYVPHDNKGLIALNGGRAAFTDKLTTAVEHHYEAYNEPGMLQTYLFTHAGRPDRTQHYVRKALSHFSSASDGLPGNDDSGTTSAWLVWSMLGIYPHAGEDYYYVGSPVFRKATIELGNGRRFVLEAPASSDKALHVRRAQLGGKPFDQAWLRHADIMRGAKLRLDMAEQPGAWAQGGALPPSVSPPAR
ncbi:GH92 family glycosyl hydrolase [Massilia glaciei]|uniref:GH92 family glycosyl hydrolase n=1 Tax=Massilia glaciei TaxID=1524097 RepID=UPI0015E7EDD0|nr:GH92 family glycosyl hydrolase [Massilia glaciei]